MAQKLYQGTTTRFIIGDMGGYLMTGCELGELRHVDIKITKQGSTMAGVVDTLCGTINQALQSRVIPLVEILERMVGMNYEPNGLTNDEMIPTCTSLSDYVAKRLALDYLDEEDWVRLGL